MMNYEGRKTHGRDNLYIRGGLKGLYPIVEVKIKEEVIDKKEKQG